MTITPPPNKKKSNELNHDNQVTENSKVMLTLSDDQLNTLIRKTTTDVLTQIKESNMFKNEESVNDASKLTLKKFFDLHKSETNMSVLGKTILNAFLNTDPDSILYHDIYDFFFKYRVGEIIIRYTIDISDMTTQTSRWNYKKEFDKSVTLTNAMFETIGKIVSEQFKTND